MKKTSLILCLLLLSILFAACQKEPAIVLSFIEISENPTKLVYTEGEKFIPDGMKITANFSDGESNVITDYTYTPSGELQENDTAITITYVKDGITKTTLLQITVNDSITAAKANYSSEDFEITGGTFTKEGKIIKLTPDADKTEYTIKGYFEGQIRTDVRNTVLKLKNAYIENTEGQPAIYSEKKIEISLSKDTVNYIISKGDAEEKTAALLSEKGIELGGSGTGYIVGKICHGVKGGDVKAKGSGTYYIKAISKGSAINCNTFLIEEDKTVTVYLLNAKNGIKADESISISSGTLYLSDLDVGLKTDTHEDDSEKEHFISLENCTIYSKNVKKAYSTEENNYTENNVSKDSF